MAGVHSRSGPPGNQNALRDGLAGIAQRRADGVLNQSEGEICPAYWPIRAELHRSAPPCACWRRSAQATCHWVTFNHAIDGVIQNNPRARANPKALAELDRSEGPLVSSL